MATRTGRNTGITGSLLTHGAEEQIKARQQEIKYDLRDFTVDYLVKSFEDDLFFIPPYQREFVWNDQNQSRFIESVILGLPIPMLFVAMLDDGRLEIVDGAQRMQTLEAFLNGDLQLQKLNLLTELNGMIFSDLPVSQQRKLMTRALRLVVLEEGTSEDIRKEMFHRINTQGMRARGSEIRRGTFAGPFMDFVKDCASDPLFRELCPISTSFLLRREDEELVLRFFAYSDRYRQFKHDVDKFLDAYAAEAKDSFDKDRLLGEFQQTLQFVRRYFPTGFAKSSFHRTTPRVRFEAISVGVNLALRLKPNLTPFILPSAWLDSDEFRAHTTTHASNSQVRLRGRVEFVRDQLLREK